MPRKPSHGGINQGLIAKRLGLSIATVSRALRNVPGINSATRRAVFDLAAELGYELPSSLKAAEPRPQLFLCALSRAHPFSLQPSRFLEGMSQEAMAQGASLVMHQVADADLDEFAFNAAVQPAAMRDGMIAGLVVQYHWPQSTMKRLAAKWPLITINHSVLGVQHDMVTFDDYDGLMKLVGHLKNRGHKRIGYFGLSGDLTWSVRRWSATAEACFRLGLDLAKAVEIPARLLEAFPGDWGRYTTQAMEKPEVTAWVCPSGYVADKLHALFGANDLHVPGKRSIVVYDAHDARLADYTALIPPTLAMGKMAVARLLARIRQPEMECVTLLARNEFHQGTTSGFIG